VVDRRIRVHGLPPKCELFDGWRRARRALEASGCKLLIVDAEARSSHALVERAVDLCVPAFVLTSQGGDRKKVLELIRAGALSCLREEELERFPRLLEEASVAAAAGIEAVEEHVRGRLCAALGERPEADRPRSEDALVWAVGEGARNRILRHPRVRTRLVL
jgi:hypothetical protein